MTRLWEGLDILRDGYLIKGQRRDGDGGHCALGLLDAAHGIDRWLAAGVHYEEDARALATVAMELFPERCDPTMDRFNNNVMWNSHNQARLAAFNNHDDTTKEDLETVWHKAALRGDEVLSD